MVIVWAKCEGQIRGFLVERDTPGLTVHPIYDKLSMRASESGWLELVDCRIPKENALPGAAGLRAALTCLNEARYSIVWGVLGAAEACYAAALERVQGRVQFGRPLAGFQLVQDKLVDMLAELTKGQLLALQLGRLKERGQAHYAQISLGKRENVRAAQRVARLARELLGGDGITQMFPA
ncbi:MAG: acyl-CoA dehydrogenase, partial [Chloroflexota bacterium]